MNQSPIYARFSPRPMNCSKCLKRMNKMVGLDVYECPACEHTEAMGDGEHGSIQAQLERCREHCKHRGYDVGGKHHDEALSGASLERPGLNAAIDALKRGDVLVVHMLDRLSRGDPEQWFNIEKRIRTKGARYEFVCGEGTWGSGSRNDEPINAFVRKILQGAACYQREVSNIRTSEMMRTHQKTGRRMTSKDKVPFGLMADPDDPAKMIPNAREQDTIRTIIDTYQDVLQGSFRGKGYRELARRLADMGIRSRSGGTIAHTLAADVIKRYARLNDATKPSTPLR